MSHPKTKTDAIEVLLSLSKKLKGRVKRTVYFYGKYAYVSGAHMVIRVPVADNTPCETCLICDVSDDENEPLTFRGSLPAIMKFGKEPKTRTVISVEDLKKYATGEIDNIFQKDLSEKDLKGGEIKGKMNISKDVLLRCTGIADSDTLEVYRKRNNLVIRGFDNTGAEVRLFSKRG